jgi:glyoxylase-like metal-dependent hydrolase (beta-lactamase superfamily II)
MDDDATTTPSTAPDTENYTGHVDPRGPAATRTLAGITISKLSVGPMDNNAYLVVCRNTGEAVLIDAANDADRILELLEDAAGGPPLRAVVTTHSHGDHWQALSAVGEQTAARLYAGADDADAIPARTDVRLRHGDAVPVGDCRLEVIALRGHTPGSIALLYRDPGGSPHLFTGDSLFPGGPGKTSSPGTFSSLMNDLEARVFDRLPDETVVYPGHGDDTTLGDERPHLGEWRARGW